jgi:putative heme-binding domain-containing protein
MPVDVTGAQGMVWMNGTLYFFQSGVGLQKVTDANGDGRFDHADLLTTVFGRGEHGTHGLIDAEDGTHIYAMGGNQTPLPTAQLGDHHRVQSWQEDQLLPRQWDPRGHARGILAPGGWITRFDPDKKSYEVFAMGFRNEYDAALNSNGDLFTYDADMEWDFGMPWYRPTRICHVVSGADFGWRSGSGKFPTYYEDTTPPLVEIGPGSPTGVISGRGAKFPARYQEAIFALDWTYGRVLAIHPLPDGAGYTAEVENFIAGPAFPVTDAVIGKDGALYLTTGGRGADSALLRVTYTGSESTAPATSAPLPKDALVRRELEKFHGVASADEVDKAWPYLSSLDRFLRNAARVAIESQPVESWASRVFTEPDSQARITAAVALARSGKPNHREALTKCLLDLDFAKLPLSQQLGLLRALSLTATRLGAPDASERKSLIDYLNPHFPAVDPDLNAELLQMLVFLNEPSAVAKGMKLITSAPPATAPAWATELSQLNARYGGTVSRIAKNPPPTQAIRYAFILRNARHGWTTELRRAYFTFLNEAGKKAGGASYPGYLANIREEALMNCSDAERMALKDITGGDFNPVPDFPITPPKGPGHPWTLDEAVAATDQKTLKKADWESGRNLFHAIGCGACHRFNGLGGGVGPDLTSVPNKFDTAYLIEAIINPSKDISDQYGSSIVTLKDGRSVMGLVVEQDDKAIRVFPADLKAEGELIQRSEVQSIAESPASQMPPGLLNSLAKQELRDLTAYIMSGGNPPRDAKAKK